MDEIEARLAKGESLRSIARDLGVSLSTLHRYKKAVFDLKVEARRAWDEERKKNHEQRKAEGKARIVNNLELLNLVKLRAEQLLSIEAGQEYQNADGETRTVTFHTAATLWEKATKMATDAIKQELELIGDDPVSRLADGVATWAELVQTAADEND
ncbi:MAG TPA: hypothetical protein PKI14_09680 [Fervidobacterium sp.]|nr:hypothetical protein [Fervidobacterium sp.]